jgi:hypothetical protein
MFVAMLMATTSSYAFVDGSPWAQIPWRAANVEIQATAMSESASAGNGHPGHCAPEGGVVAERDGAVPLPETPGRPASE